VLGGELLADRLEIIAWVKTLGDLADLVR